MADLQALLSEMLAFAPNTLLAAAASNAGKRPEQAFCSCLGQLKLYAHEHRECCASGCRWQHMQAAAASEGGLQLLTHLACMHTASRLA